MVTAGILRSALASDRPFDELSATASRLVAQGQPRPALVGELHRLSTALQVTGNGQAGAIVRSVMDRLGGWCAPELRI